jgi:non-heme chloroperoxidase
MAVPASAATLAISGNSTTISRILSPNLDNPRVARPVRWSDSPPGAGFSIRFAGGPYGALFDRYVLLSPTTLLGAPTLRTNAGGWINVAVPRIVAINWLNRRGIHCFDGLPVISYAISPEMAKSMTASYSYRLLVNFGAGPQYETYLRNIRRPTVIFVGDADEQVIADQFVPLLQRLGLNIPVTLVPNMKHTDMIHKTEAFRAIVPAISQQP